MNKSSVTGRFSAIFLLALALPAFSAAQHHGGGFAARPVAAGRSGAVISRGAPIRATARAQSGTQSAVRAGAPISRTRNGVRTTHRNNSNNFGNGNFGFDGFNGTDFQNVPGLGFDYPHLAATSGNRRFHNGRFGGGFPFGFGGGFLLGPSVLDQAPVSDADSESSAPDEQQIAADAPAQRPRRARPSPQAEPEADSAPVPPREEDQYVFVRRDGSLVFAVAYAWDSGTLRYITPDGLRRTMGREALDLDATQQFNEQRGLNFRAPA
jgi:hypothetical protein